MSIKTISEKDERHINEWEAGLNWARKVEKPWGYELIYARTPFYGGKILHVEKGHELSWQYHIQKDETMYVHSGKIQLTLEDERGEDRQIFVLEPGQSYRVRPGVRHSVKALETTDILETSTPHFDDIVRLKDRYGRIS